MIVDTVIKVKPSSKEEASVLSVREELKDATYMPLQGQAPWMGVYVLPGNPGNLEWVKQLQIDVQREVAEMLKDAPAAGERPNLRESVKFGGDDADER